MITIISVFCSCELEDRIIELPDHDSRLVLNAQVFQSDTSSNIIVTESIGITDTFLAVQNEALTNSADLTLYTPDQGAITGYVYKQPSEYENVQLPFWKFDYQDYIAGETYKVEATADGYDMIVAHATVPYEPGLVDVEVTIREGTPTTFFVRDRFEITINDPADQENYYQIRADYIIDDNGFESLRKYRFYDTPQNPIDESFLENHITVISDKSFNGTEHKFITYGERGSYDFREIRFTIFEISKEAYDYQVAFDRWNTDNPFAEPVTFPSNIDNGFGIFSISSKPVVQIIEI